MKKILNDKVERASNKTKQSDFQMAKIMGQSLITRQKFDKKTKTAKFENTFLLLQIFSNNENVSKLTETIKNVFIQSFILRH